MDAVSLNAHDPGDAVQVTQQDYTLSLFCLSRIVFCGFHHTFVTTPLNNFAVL
jgi:hypothetical protein